MKRQLVWFVILLLFVPVLCGCAEKKAAAKQAKIESTIIDIMNDTKFNPSYSPTVGEMIATVFTDYEIAIKQVENTEATYIVTVTGDYVPNPDVAFYVQSGLISYTVNIEKNTCQLRSDPNNIQGATFLLYVFNYM